MIIYRSKHLSDINFIMIFVRTVLQSNKPPSLVNEMYWFKTGTEQSICRIYWWWYNCQIRSIRFSFQSADWRWNDLLARQSYSTRKSYLSWQISHLVWPGKILNDPILYLKNAFLNLIKWPNVYKLPSYCNGQCMATTKKIADSIYKTASITDRHEFRIEDIYYTGIIRKKAGL